MEHIPDMKHFRRQSDHRFLPDSRTAWLLELVAAVLIGASLAAAYVAIMEQMR